MSRSLYLAATGPGSGKSLVALGAMELLIGQSGRVGFFRPIVSASDGTDKDIALISNRFGLKPGELAVSVFTHAEARRLIAAGRHGEVHKTILDAYKQLQARCDFVLCEGTDYTGVSSAFEFDFNVEVAMNLGCPVLMVVNGHGTPTEEIVDQVTVTLRLFLARGVKLAGAVVNRVDAPQIAALQAGLEAADCTRVPVYTIPEEASLARPTVRDATRAVRGTQIHGTERSLSREVADIKVAAMHLHHFLDHLTPGCLVVVPGDRSDILVASLLANRSAAFPGLAGLILTGGMQPGGRVRDLLDGVSDAALPIISTPDDTFTVASRLAEVSGWLTPDNERKIALALGMFQSAVDAEELTRRIELARPSAVTPLMFEYQVLQRAAADRRRIVLAEGEDERILRAADILIRRKVADLILLGRIEKIRSRASAMGLNIEEAELIHPATSPLRSPFAQAYKQARSHKAVTLDQATDVMGDVSYFGTMMVQLGRADGMVSGAVNTTAHTIRPAFEFVKTRPEVSLVSSVFFMCLDDRVLVYGDCAVNPKPTAEELADIAVSAADTAAMFDIEPRVAMISYSTGASGHGAEVDRVREATRLAQGRRPDLLIEGPIQYDAAADLNVGRSKMPGSAVAGRASVFIFPDLNAGNSAYKAVQRSAHAVAVGPVLQGLNKPINDLSRGCTVTDIVNTVAITAIQAQEQS